MQLFSNNFKTTLAAAVDNVTTSITVVSSVGLPTLGVGDTVLVTLESTNRLVVEIVEVTAVVGNVLTVVRGREGTVASSFNLGSFVEGRLTAGWLNSTATKLGTIETGAQVNTVTPTNVVGLTNKTLDDISNNVGANRVHYKVKNMTGSTLANGTVVKVAGYEAGEETIRVAPTTSTGDVAIGIVHGSIAQGEVGLVVNTGVATGVNTTGYTTGSMLYQNGSGGLTHTKPTTGTYQAVAVPLNAKTDGALLVEFTEPNPVDWDSRYYTETEVNNLLSGKQATITGAATTITSSNLTASMALVSDSSGKVAAHGTVSATELGYLDGVTSSVQTQLNSKEPTITTLPVSKGGTGTTTSTGTGSVVLSNSPAFTGTPTGTTAPVGTNTTQLATTAFVQAEIANDAPTKTGTGASGTWGISITGNAATASALSAGSVAADSGIFHLNNQVVTTSYSIPTGKNAMTAGPISINNGITVTIPDGSTWTVV